MVSSTNEQPLTSVRPATRMVNVPSVSSLKRRRNLVKSACSRCRSGKVKCDGKRPICSRCSKFADAEQCTYDVEDGDTRQDALKKRTAGMAKELQNALNFIESLKTMPSGQLEMAMANVRASPNVTSFLEQFRTTGSPPTSPGSDDSTCAVPPVRPVGVERTQSQNAASDSSTISSSRRNDARLTELPSGDLVPNRYLVEETVRCFFDCSSKLFQVFSPDEILPLIDEIYDGRPSVSNRTAMAIVFSLAAVGCAYIQKGAELEDLLFDGAKMSLDDAIESNPAQAAKVCCMLGMRLLFQKHRASLTFIEMGLELCRRLCLDSQTKPFDKTQAQWIDGRKTWRTLFFLASWLSSSVGYLSKSPCWVEAFSQHNMDIRGETSLEDLVQTAMVKVSILKFSILRFNLDSGPLTGLSLNAMSKDLQRWYAELPEQMHLINVQDPAISDALRRTVYFCHLLYLGCLILLARRVIYSEVVSSNSVPLATRFPDSEILVENAVTAAQQTARILGLLQRDDGVFRRCWLCIFQAYVASIICMFALANALRADDYTKVDDLADCVARCLDVLDYCRKEDHVAARFYAVCQPIFSMLSGYRKFSIPSEMLDTTIKNLLDMFCMPFGDGAELDIPVVSSWKECEPAETRLRDYSLVISRAQGFEAAQPFHKTSITEMAPGPAVQGLLKSLGPSHFVNDRLGQVWPETSSRA